MRRSKRRSAVRTDRPDNYLVLLWEVYYLLNSSHSSTSNAHTPKEETKVAIKTTAKVVIKTRLIQDKVVAEVEVETEAAIREDIIIIKVEIGEDTFLSHRFNIRLMPLNSL
jgi:hypothetical protein